MNRRSFFSLAGGLAITGCARLRRPPPIAWVRTLEEADAISMRHPTLSSRPLFLWFDATWDSAGKELEEVTFTDPSVRSLLDDHYIAVAIDGSDDEEPAWQRAAQRFAITGTPTIITYTPHFGREVTRINQFVLPRELLAMLSG